MTLKVFETFSGIGTQRMALENIGIDFQVVGISEIDKYCLKTYEEMFGSTKNYGDIKNIQPKELPDIDLLTYSFPCKNLSRVGLEEGMNKGSGTQSSLLWDCEKIIREKKPKYLLMENVKNLVGKTHIKNFKLWLNLLEEMGYKSYYQVLNVKDYGIPQNRERVYVVSIKDNKKKYKFPEPTKLKFKPIDILEDNVDEKYIVPRIMIENWYKKKGDFGKRFSITKLNEYAYTLVAKGGRAVITNNYLPYDLGRYEEVKDLKSKKGIKYILDNNIEIRSFTPKEYWRLMGISDDYFDIARQVTSDNQLYIQAGDAIVVDVLELIFKNLLL